MNTIGRHRLEIAQSGDFCGKLSFVLYEAPIFLDHGGQRVDENAATITVDNDRMTIQGSDIARSEPHYCRYSEFTGENSRMRDHGAAQAYDAFELSRWHVRDAGETDLVTEKYRLARILLDLVTLAAARRMR